MPGEKHLILGSVCPDIAVELKQRIPCVLWQHALHNGVQVQATARHTKGKLPLDELLSKLSQQHG